MIENRMVLDDYEVREPRLISHCSQCGKALWEDDEFVDIDGEFLCYDMDCLLKFANGEIVSTQETVTCATCGDKVDEDYDMLYINHEYICYDYDCLLKYLDAKIIR